MIALADLVTQLRQIELKATNSGHRAVAGQAADRLARLEALMPTIELFEDLDTLPVGVQPLLRDLLQLRGTGQ